MFGIATSKVLAEKDIERAVCKFARTLGWIERKFSSPAHAGEPDRIFFRDGKTVMIEFKRTGQRPTRLQRERLQAYTDAGFLAVSCDNIEYGKSIFEMLERDK